MGGVPLRIGEGCDPPMKNLMFFCENDVISYNVYFHFLGLQKFYTPDAERFIHVSPGYVFRFSRYNDVAEIRRVGPITPQRDNFLHTTGTLILGNSGRQIILLRPSSQIAAMHYFKF